MASVNADPEDLITSVDEHEDSGFGVYTGSVSVNRSYNEDGEEDEDLLSREQEGDKDDVTLVACLPPKDRFWGVYAIFYFLGITTLLPWNFFVNADKYWMYKFRDVNATKNDSSLTFLNLSNDIPVDLHPLHGKTPFQASFTSYLAIASNLPSTICFLLNPLIAKWVPGNVRMITSLIITFILFLSSTVLVEMNTDKWQQGFFVVTMISVIFMNAFCAFFQCGLLQIVGRFPPEYSSAVMSGQALGGILASSANVLSIVFAADQVKSAFIYFTLGCLSLLFSVCATIYMPRTLFYKFFMGSKPNQPYRFIENYPPQARIRPTDGRRAKGFIAIFKKVWIQAVSVMLVFLVTLAAFPALLVLVVSEEVPSVWNDKYYVAVVSFLVFGCGDYLGRILSGSLQLPDKSSPWTLIFAIMRIGFLPMIMLCELHPRKHLPVIFKSDIEFGIINFLFGISNGYLANIVFINAPQLVPREDQEDANGVVSTALGIGLSLGVTLSYFLLILL